MKDDYNLNPYRALVNREEPKKTITIHIHIHDWPVQWTREPSTYDSIVFAVRSGKSRLPDNDKSVMADYMYDGDVLELTMHGPEDLT
jgi:hypothetical protein